MLRFDLPYIWRRPAGAPGFQLLGITVSAVSDSSVTIEWVMNEVCSGQLEYGTTAAMGSFTTAQSILGGYSRHVQTITGLAAGQTIYFQSISTNAAGITVRSDVLVAVTTGTTPVTSVGPRTVPALPTTYVVVPSSVPSNGTNASVAMQAFIDSVPNGTTIVFDKTETGTGGTEYTLSDGIRLRNRSGLTFWGYGSAFDMTRTDGNVLGSGFLIEQGSEDIQVLGFDIGGRNTPTNLMQLYSYLGGESSMGVAIYSARNVAVKDCTIHHVNGDGIYVSGAWLDATATSKGWTGIGPWDFSYNYIHHVGRQGITNNWGNGQTLEYNLIEDIAAYPFDAEDHSDSRRTTSQVYIRHNELRRWAWWTQFTPPLAMTHSFTRGEIGTIDRWEFSDNWLDEGYYGAGHPDSGVSSVAAWFVLHSSYDGDGVPITDLFIERNVSTVQADNLYYSSREKGAVWLENKVNVTIRDNDFQGMKIVHSGTTGTVTISGNGSSPVSTSL